MTTYSVYGFHYARLQTIPQAIKQMLCAIVLHKQDEERHVQGDAFVCISLLLPILPKLPDPFE